MKIWLKRLKYIMYPPMWIIILTSIIAYTLVIYTLTYPNTNPFIVYFSYIFSAYITIVICLHLQRVIAFLNKCIYGDELRLVVWLRKNILKTPEFRAKISLYIGLAVNILFGIFKGMTGYLFQSAWLFAIGVYYITLAFVRFILLHNVKVTEKEEQTVQRKRKEWKSYRTCGIMLLFVDVAMAGMIVQMVWQDKCNIYPGWTIYASALYTFYYFITALISMIRYFHWENAIVSAAKNVTFAGAAMSLLMLQTAMISTFGEVAESSRMMNGITGAVVSVFCIGMSVFMILRSNCQLRKLKANTMYK